MQNDIACYPMADGNILLIRRQDPHAFVGIPSALTEGTIGGDLTDYIERVQGFSKRLKHAANSLAAAQGNNTGILSVNVVEFELKRQISYEQDATGNVTDMKPVEGTDSAVLNLQLPGGTVVRAAVSVQDFETHIFPIIRAKAEEKSRIEG